jgi:vacuolar-type H+-ATPase subunit C/Vma6
MIQATFTFSGAEFNPDLIDKIKKIFQGDEQNIEIFIRVKAKESADANRKRIENAAHELERNENTILLTGNEFDSLIQQLAKR